MQDNGTRFQASPDGIMGSALVTDDTVFFGDIGGWFYALDRATGAERWKLNARAQGLPGRPSDQRVHRLADPRRRQADRRRRYARAARCRQRRSIAGRAGRGFVMALEPKTGRIVWKYDVGPKPEPLESADHDQG